jgi:hypothetical protein
MEKLTIRQDSDFHKNTFIGKTNKSHFPLDFCPQIAFNVQWRELMAKTALRQNRILWMMDAGDSPQGRGRRDKCRIPPERHENFRQKDCILTELWKA